MDKMLELLELLDKETKNIGGFERTLYLLLKEFEKDLPEIDDYFHKTFRQVDVTFSGKIDLAIWHALQESEIFWKCFSVIVAKDNKDE